MNWQTIDTYDNLKIKPKLALFWFEGVAPSRGSQGKYSLSPMAHLSRVFGSRICTHWIEIPIFEE